MSPTDAQYQPDFSLPYTGQEDTIFLIALGVTLLVIGGMLLWAYLTRNRSSGYRTNQGRRIPPR